MKNPIFPWQKTEWQQLQAMREHLPHAILFYGPAGIGKTWFAERFAQSLLCETPMPDRHACGECASCGWFEQYSHPDYRRLRPEALDEADGETEGEDSAKSAKATKAPSKELRIAQIRGLTDFMNVSTHRSGKRVVLLYPAEALNAESANALLKTLEEPPPATVFLLVSNSLDRLLPTILSRCRKFALGMPAPDDALVWLKAQDVTDAEMWLAERGGAPLAALEAARGESRDIMEDLLRQLATPSIDGALKTAERLHKAPVPQQVECLQRWLHDLLSVKLCGTIRYYPRYKKELASLGAQMETDDLMRTIQSAADRRRIAEHPLSPKLFIEDMLLEYARLVA